jgi:hypothetical protein
MQFQFTIGRLLFATSAFAVVLGLCAPFDSLSVACGIPIASVVFVILLVVKEPTRTVDDRVYPSRLRAVLAGIWQGALYGVKWAVIIGIAFMLMFGAAVVETRRMQGGDFAPGLASPADFVWATICIVGMLSSGAAFAGALIAGVGRGAAWTKVSTPPPAETSQVDLKSNTSEG